MPYKLIKLLRETRQQRMEEEQKEMERMTKERERADIRNQIMS
jgi:hypothetical protein